MPSQTLSSLLVAITPLYIQKVASITPLQAHQRSSPSSGILHPPDLRKLPLQLYRIETGFNWVNLSTHMHTLFLFEALRESILQPAFNDAGTPPKLPICTDSTANSRVSLSPIEPAGEAERGLKGYEVCLWISFLLQLAVLACWILELLSGSPF